ncbi:glycosyltransferase [Schaedlerella arabinosiphila]|uniref:Glycosyltransferase n=1 Tax=Schaedlerella arabinosiphila TaxID=2044587 RepID=A0A9X5CA18_9FIRM|nr:glycosyltransferase [Schaedlerella arabinosiphila]KAI4440726.1 hypothetical protein C824_003225 [Schaedlerella arabinosiphila]NDO69423.1 glycosyltransferase [Schaedlerella arabinosiphila]
MSAVHNIAFHIIRDIKRMVIKTKLETEYNFKMKLQNNVQIIKKNNCQQTLFVTHNLGGGTQQFEDSFVGLGNNILILRRLGYMFMQDAFFQIESNGDKKIIKVSDIKKIWDLNFDEIIINSMVGFSCIESIIDNIVNYKKQNPECTIRYFVHDYDCICPLHNLFFNGKYCELNCLNCNLQLDYRNKKVDIRKWRHIWKKLLVNVDEIRCFSFSSKELIKKIYKNINNISVVPHDTSYIKTDQKLKMNQSQMCIGFIGSITNGSKGNIVVKKIIGRYGNQIDIRLIGSNKLHYIFDKGKKVKKLGTYNRDDLRNILINEKVNVIIFPSLWPETFSYVVSELMAFDITIICFDLGAQGEKIRNYHKGIVCKNIGEMFSIIDSIYKESTKGY